MIHEITNKEITIKEVIGIVSEGKKLALSKESKKQIRECREFLERKMQSGDIFYGINTGFGSLCNILIPDEDLHKLQHNLIVSHASGMGDIVEDNIVRLMLLLKIQSLSYGYSGIRETVVSFLIDMFNNDIIPVIPKFGSLGASGDLAPLAHMSLPLLGIGNVKYKGELMDAEVALSKAGLSPLELASKEGLALVNGTQFMSAFGCLIINLAEKLLHKMSVIAALSVDASCSDIQPFNHLIQKIRKHEGQSIIAAEILKYLEGSEIADTGKDHIQDPYSFRCIPQVHGSVYSVISHVKEIFTNEINAVTDNPNIFREEKEILSGGNFHGEALAMALDYLSIALAELGSISERRIYFLLSGKRELPVFLVPKAGLNSGLMIPQYTAASLVSRNKQLSMPSSTDNIDSSNGQEDHVSMGANAAIKCYEIYKNLEQIIAIELLVAVQALSFRKEQKTSPVLQKIVKEYRSEIAFLSEDRFLHEDMMKSLKFLQQREDLLC